MAVKSFFKKIANLKERSEALVFYNDWNAIGFIETALSYGVDIPCELRVTGFDNLPLSKFYKVPLTTVDYNLHDLVSQAPASLPMVVGSTVAKRPSCIKQEAYVIDRSSLR